MGDSELAEFSIRDTAFTGFRIVRERRDALPIWVLVASAASLIFMTITSFWVAPALPDLKAAAMSSDVAAKALSRLAPSIALLLVAGVLFNATLHAAMNRVVMRPEQSELGYFRLGRDELRQCALLVLIAAVFGLPCAAWVLGYATFMLGVLKGRFEPALFLELVCGAAALVWMSVRLSLAGALTFDRGQVSLMGSWRLTRGRFWRLFSVYLLARAAGGLALILATLIVILIATALSGTAGNPANPPLVADVRQLTTLPGWIELLLNAAVSALIWPVMLTPAASIYRQLTRDQSVLTAGKAYT